MRTALDKPSTWWKEPMVWLLIALPLSAVVGGMVTIWLATQKADGLVSENYYREGLAIHQVIERDARAAALSAAARLSAEGRRLAVHLEGELSPPPRLLLTIVHPTQSGQDHTVPLQRLLDGLYHGDLPPLEAGEKRLILESPDRSWRLTGRWRSPFSGSLVLRSKPAPSPPQP